MAILWLILKVILSLLLLGILLILGLLALVLLGPISYKGYYERYERLEGEIEIILFHLVKLRHRIDGEETGWRIKLLGLEIYPGKPNFLRIILKKSKGHTKTPSKSNEAPKVSKERKMVPEYLEETTDSSSAKSSTKKRELLEKREEEQKKSMDWKQIKNFLTTPGLGQMLKEGMKAVGKTLQALKPKTFYFHLVIGKENPADTGELMALLTLVFPWYYRYGIIQGDFEEAGIGGDISFAGRFRLVTFVKIGLQGLMNKEIRTMISHWINQREEE